MSTSGSGWRIHGDDTCIHTATPSARGSNLLLDQVSSLEELEFTAASEGCGGVYFVTDHLGERVGVFKPEDEEIGAENNPKGYTDGQSCRCAGAPREVAAYVLDQLSGGWSGVPATAHVVATRTTGEEKRGSLQAHVAHDDSAENFGASMMPVLDVHKIGVLDIRLVNNDRHFANILVSRNKDGAVGLTPIDHGEILPSCHDLGRVRFEWMQWKQSKLPFNKETLSHIASLDPERDADYLRTIGIEEECIVSMVLTTKVLQLGALNGMSLWEIGNLIQRDLGVEDEQSALEKAILKIVKASEPGVEDTSVWAKNVILQACRIAKEVILPGSDAAVTPKSHDEDKSRVDYDEDKTRVDSFYRKGGTRNSGDESEPFIFSLVAHALHLLVSDHERHSKAEVRAGARVPPLQNANQLNQLRSVLIVVVF